MSKKRKIIYITIAAAIVIIAALAIIFMPKTAPQTVTEMLSTAQKYLVEMEYERAIAEFNKVIELDPMNADAYLGLAEAYEKSGDIDKAIETLKNGFEFTGDERLQARLALLNGGNAETTVTSETTTAEVTTAAEPEEVKYVNVQGFEIPTNIMYLTMFGPDTDNWSSSTETDELSNVYRLNEPITDISFLADFKNLHRFDLSINNISDISVLSGLTNLTYLYLDDNQISDISALSGLTNLTYLYLDDNQISDISALSGLTNLTVLSLNDNQISDISVLSGLTNLSSLRLHGNPISDISILSGLTNLTYLWLEDNQISDADIESLKSSLPNCYIEY